MESFRSLRRAIGRLPVIGPAAKTLYHTIVPRPAGVRFESSPQYWQDRYAQGGNSGSGSYGRLAKFKAEILNKFVADRNIRTIIEFGSGDGAQLELAHYPDYIGVDISPRAIELCRSRFQNDPTKRFMLTSSQEAIDARAELAMSLDVIYHLVEDDIYHQYMVRLASASDKFICVYSSNIDRASKDSHVRHRMFTEWFEKNAPAWRVILKVANPFPENPETPGETSWADFYFLEKAASSH